MTVPDRIREIANLCPHMMTRKRLDELADGMTVPGDVGDLVEEFNRFVGCFQYDENKVIGERIIAALTALVIHVHELEQERDRLANIIGVARCPSDGRHFVAECIQAKTCGCSIGLVVAALTPTSKEESR
jgi:hypothetical protein